jgi:transcriptional regulator with XRE-family HTH domain
MLVNLCKNVAMPNVNAGAKAWELGLAGRVGSAIQVRRKELDLTAQQLAERTKSLGYPISRVAISKIEGNKRAGKFDVAELLVLAQALELAPLQLLFPDELDDDIELLPGEGTLTSHAITWFTGGPGPMWPSREVAELTKKLDRITANMAPGAIMGLVPGSFMRPIAAPTAEADVKGKEETK